MRQVFCSTFASLRMLMERLLEHSDQLDGIPGLVYQNHDGQTVGTEPQAAYVDLDESVISSWELLNLHPYDLGLRTGFFYYLLEEWGIELAPSGS
jgi:hypothetical protein